MQPGCFEYNRFVASRNHYVKAICARDLIQSIIEVLGIPHSHVLANLSVTQGSGDPKASVGAKLDELNNSIKFYEITLRSGGRNAPGERVSPGVFAAKGVYDWMERTPGRNWINTGYGANVQSVDFGSPSGGRGKPVKMYVQPFSSPPVIGMRSGAHNGAGGHEGLVEPSRTTLFSLSAPHRRTTKIAMAVHATAGKRLSPMSLGFRLCAVRSGASLGWCC